MEPQPPTHITGKIIVSGLSPRSCAILDISDKGAALRVSSMFGIPDVFDLLIGTSTKPRRCRVLHKAANKLEVSFE